MKEGGRGGKRSTRGVGVSEGQTRWPQVLQTGGEETGEWDKKGGGKGQTEYEANVANRIENKGGLK